MKIIHPYRDSFAKALLKHNMINQNSGFKLNHCYKTPEDKKFNTVAAIGTELHDWVCREKMPMYVDRLHGGTYYHRYPFSTELMRHYREKIGDEFLGLSIHEMGNVRRLDWNRIQTTTGHHAPWTKEEIEECIRKVSEDKVFIHLSCGNAEEYRDAKEPRSYRELLKDFEHLVKLRKQHFDGFCFPCEGGPVTTKIHLENGAKMIFTEQGAQTRNLRGQTAYARGMAKAYGAKWGVFYEPWGNDGTSSCSAPYLVQDELNEWFSIKSSDAKWPVHDHGFGGGSSRSLQRRCGFYALTSGADYYSEEWEMGNTFSYVGTAELSTYGEILKELVHYSGKTDSIRSVVKVAFVLPKEMLYFDTGLTPSGVLGHYPDYQDPQMLPQAEKVVDLISPFVGNTPFEGCGTEYHVMKHLDMPDSFDILHEDAPQSVLDTYDILVDTTLENRLSSYKGKAQVLSGTAEEVHDAIKAALEKALGFSMEGALIVQPYVQNGKCCLAFYNGDGIRRTWQKGDERLPEGAHTVSLTFDGPIELTPDYQSNPDIRIEKEGNTYRFTLPAGDCCLIHTNWDAEKWGL